MNSRLNRSQAITKPETPHTSTIARRRLKLEMDLKGFRILNGGLIERLKAREEEIKQLKEEIKTLKTAQTVRKFGDTLPL
jgi:hypothetical protein